jgi:hypothetical protein
MEFTLACEVNKLDEEGKTSAVTLSLFLIKIVDKGLRNMAMGGYS